MSTEAFERAATQEVLDWLAIHCPGVPLVVENGPIPDRNGLQEFVDLQFRYYGAVDITVGTRPIVRDTGVISLRHYAREQTGTGRTRQVVEGLREHLRARRLGGAAIFAPQRTTGAPAKGWYSSGLLAPFKLDTR